MLAQPLGYVEKADLFHAVKAIVATQRDYGRRSGSLPLCCRLVVLAAPVVLTAAALCVVSMQCCC